MNTRPIELTREEALRLKEIKEHYGKGYIRDYCIKMVHICPNCKEASSWRGDPPFSCSNCGTRVTPEEWTKLPTEERWIYLGKSYCAYLEEQVSKDGSDCPKDCPMKKSKVCVVK